MRSKEEISEAVERVLSEIPHVPMHNAFGENNHEKINAAAYVIQEGIDYMEDLENLQDEQGWNDSVVDHIQEAINYNEGYCEIEDVLFHPDSDYRNIAAPEVAPTVPLIQGFGTNLSDTFERDSTAMSKKVIHDSGAKGSARLCNKKTCGDCPFSNNSMRGFLADYSAEDFQNFQQAEMNFPCHKHMNDDGMSALEAHSRVDNGEMPFCRGYVESIIKSGAVPKKNTKLMEAIELVKLDGLSDNTMSMSEFREFHDLENIISKNKKAMDKFIELQDIEKKTKK